MSASKPNHSPREIVDQLFDSVRDSFAGRGELWAIGAVALDIENGVANVEIRLNNTFQTPKDVAAGLCRETAQVAAANCLNGLGEEVETAAILSGEAELRVDRKLKKVWDIADEPVDSSVTFIYTATMNDGPNADSTLLLSWASGGSEKSDEYYADATHLFSWQMNNFATMFGAHSPPSG